MSNYNLDLYFFYECPFCVRVLDTIEKLGLKNKINFKNIREDAKALQKLVSDTGRRTVPCLYINDKPMHESADIMKWLEKNQNSI